VTAQLESFSPGFFLWNQYTVATHLNFSFVGKPGLLPGGTFTPAKPGEAIVLWGTGFGPTDPAIPAGQVVDKANNLVNTPTILIDGAPAEYLGGALTPGNAGLYQIAVKVPSSTRDGDVPVVARVGGMSSPNGVLLTVQR